MKQTMLTMSGAPGRDIAGPMSRSNLHLSLFYSLLVSYVVCRFPLDFSFHLSLFSLFLLIWFVYWMYLSLF